MSDHDKIVSAIFSQADAKMKMHEEIERLRAENEQLRASLSAEKALTKACERVNRSNDELLDKVRALRAALEPFADEGAGLTDEHDDLPYDYGMGDCGCFTNGHLRAAAAALKETGDE